MVDEKVVCYVENQKNLDLVEFQLMSLCVTQGIVVQLGRPFWVSFFAIYSFPVLMLRVALLGPFLFLLLLKSCTCVAFHKSCRSVQYSGNSFCSFVLKICDRSICLCWMVSLCLRIAVILIFAKCFSLVVVVFNFSAVLLC